MVRDFKLDNKLISSSLKWIKVSRTVFFYCSLFLLIYLLFSQFIYAYFVSIDFHGLAIDGTFQLFNPLRRMGEGQTPGRDFQFFHGLGIVYLHYLPYVLFGKNLFASEMARYLISTYLFTLTNYLFLHSVNISKEIALLFCVIIAFAGEFLGLYSLLYPGISLLGVRSAMPVITASVLIYLLKDERGYKLASKSYLLEIFIAFLLVICFFLSTEHGIAALLSMLITLVLFPFLKKSFLENLKSAFVVFVFFILFTVSLYFICSGWDFDQPLKYALIDVPQDQFWYFGSPPSPLLRSIWDINKPVLYRVVFAVIFLLPLSLYFYFKDNQINRFEAATVVFLIIYGITSNIGYLAISNPDYSVPLYRVEILVVIYYCLKAFPSILNFNKLANSIHNILGFFLTVALLLLGLTFVRLNLYNPFSQLQVLSSLQLTSSHKVLGTYLGPVWAQSYQTAKSIIGDPGDTALVSKPWTDVNWINGISRGSAGFFVDDLSTLVNIKLGNVATFAGSGSRRITAINGDQVYVEGAALDPVTDGYPHPIIVNSVEKTKISKFDIWSTYAGLIEAEYGVFHPDTDYIIHALGSSARKKYVETFRATRPKFVTTVRSKFTSYEQWLQNTSWDFYEEIVNNYTPVAFTHYSVIWERHQDDLWQAKTKWDGEVNTDVGAGKKVEIPLDPKLYPDKHLAIVVGVDYKIANPWLHLPLFGKLPRYFLQPSNTWSTLPISLPPYQSTLQFPLYLEPKSKPMLTLDVASLLPGVNFKITNLRYRILQVPEVNIRALMDVEAE